MLVRRAIDVKILSEGLSRRRAPPWVFRGGADKVTDIVDGKHERCRMLNMARQLV